jgi:integrase
MSRVGPQFGITAPPLAVTVPASTVSTSVATIPTQRADGLSIADAITGYKADAERRFKMREIGSIQRDAIGERIDAAAAAFPSLAAPLTSIQRDELLAAVMYWTVRPVSSAIGRRISPSTVTARVGALGQFFRWAWEAELWDGFRAWDTHFGVDEKSLLLPSEKAAAKKGKPKFTVDELAILFSNATDRTKMYMMLALNCGMGQMEQTTLRTFDLKLDAPAQIVRERNKTGVDARWTLWPETAAALQRWTGKYAAWAEAILNQGQGEYKRPAARAGEPIVSDIEEPETLALKTEDGYPLCHGSTDAIGLAWQRLYQNPNVREAVKNKTLRKINFYRLRTTAAQWIREIGGYETHQLFLAHSTLERSGGQSTAEKHYTDRTDAEFARLADATAALRTKLQPMFDAKAAPFKSKRGRKPKLKAA